MKNATSSTPPVDAASAGALRASSSASGAIEKAAALVEAHPYIREFQGKTVVVKIGGSIMDEPEALSRLLTDVCFMATVGMRPVLVHGGGKSITAAMQKAGLEAQFVQGRRYTDERTLAIAEHVLINEVNRGMIDLIRGQGHDAMGLHSLASCAVFAKRLFLSAPASEGETGGKAMDANVTGKADSPGAGRPTRKIDVGFVGEVAWVNAELLEALVKTTVIPVIAPIARDATGGKLNVNADSVAGHVAAALRAEKLVLVSDTHGIRTRADDPESLASHLTGSQITDLIGAGVISAGMLPKVEAAMTALKGGVRKVHIIDGRIAHSLLLEIYTTRGIGTEIVTGA